MKRHKRASCRILRCTRRLYAAGFCKVHLVREADRMFSLRVRERDGRCRVCESRWRLQCAHIIRREFKPLRWDLANAVTLCSACHRFYTDRLEEWTIWVDGEFGAGTWAALRDRREDGDWQEAAIAWATRGGGT